MMKKHVLAVTAVIALISSLAVPALAGNGGAPALKLDKADLFYTDGGLTVVTGKVLSYAKSGGTRYSSATSVAGGYLFEVKPWRQSLTLVDEAGHTCRLVVAAQPAAPAVRVNPVKGEIGVKPGWLLESAGYAGLVAGNVRALTLGADNTFVFSYKDGGHSTPTGLTVHDALTVSVPAQKNRPASVKTTVDLSAYVCGAMTPPATGDFYMAPKRYPAAGGGLFELFVTRNGRSRWEKYKGAGLPAPDTYIRRAGTRFHWPSAAVVASLIDFTGDSEKAGGDEDGPGDGDDPGGNGDDPGDGDGGDDKGPGDGDEKDETPSVITYTAEQYGGKTGTQTTHIILTFSHPVPLEKADITFLPRSTSFSQEHFSVEKISDTVWHMNIIMDPTESYTTSGDAYITVTKPPVDGSPVPVYVYGTTE